MISRQDFINLALSGRPAAKDILNHMLGSDTIESLASPKLFRKHARLNHIDFPNLSTTAWATPSKQTVLAETRLSDVEGLTRPWSDGYDKDIFVSDWERITKTCLMNMNSDLGLRHRVEEMSCVVSIHDEATGDVYYGFCALSKSYSRRALYSMLKVGATDPESQQDAVGQFYDGFIAHFQEEDWHGAFFVWTVYAAICRELPALWRASYKKISGEFGQDIRIDLMLEKDGCIRINFVFRGETFSYAYMDVATFQVNEDVTHTICKATSSLQRDSFDVWSQFIKSLEHAPVWLGEIVTSYRWLGPMEMQERRMKDYKL